MKRFLFVVIDGGGNVPAQLAIARRLAGRGHDVHVLGEPSMRADVLEAGCRFHGFVNAPARQNRDRNADPVRDWELSSPIEQARRVGEQIMFGPAAAYARDVLDTIDRVRPDAIAVDCMPFGAIVGAEKSGLPAALLVHFPIHGPVRGATPFGLGLRPARGPFGRLRDGVLHALSRRLLAFGLGPVNAARRELGLRPLDDLLEQLLRLNRSLVLTSREFDFVPDGLPPHVRYVGPQLDDPAGLDEWAASSFALGRDPLVLVSFGSTYQRQERTFGRAVEALGTLPVRGLATYGAIDPPQGPAPDNVTVVRSAPHATLLPLASAVVCHGGHGTVMKALAHGLPLVVMPFGRDQKDNAVRVEVCGAGLWISANASSKRIADAVIRVLREPRFRDHARRMAAIIARDVAEDRAVAELEALAAGSTAAASDRVRQTART